MRPTWKGFLKLSLVNIPIRMYPAARSQALSFNQIHKLCNSRIKYDKRCPSCDRSVSSDEILKGYQYAKEQYIIMDEEDFTKVTLESTQVDQHRPIRRAGRNRSALLPRLALHRSRWTGRDRELRHDSQGDRGQEAHCPRSRRDERKGAGRRDPSS